jgi:ABC-type sugar transport system permease subunit
MLSERDQGAQVAVAGGKAAGRGGSGTSPSRRWAPRWAGRLADLGFAAPITVLIVVLIVVPTVTAIVYSFTDWDPGYSSPFIGLANYTQLLRSPDFHQILFNQLYLLLGLPVWLFLPLVVAYMLYDRVPVTGLFRTIYFFPSTAAPALVGILFASLLTPGGPLDAFLGLIGIHSPPDWLVSVTWVKPVLMAVLLWATLGVGVVIYSAGLSSVPAELFEAAEIDGASWWQKLRFIVLPGLLKLIELWAVILVITVFVAMFPWVYTLTRGGPGYASTTMDYDIYQNALSFGYFGLAAAEMVIMLIFIAVILVVGRVLVAVVSRD